MIAHEEGYSRNASCVQN